MSWYSLWAASVAKGTDGGPNVALVVGVTGIVGTSLARMLPRSDAPGGSWKVYGVARRPKPEWFENSPIQYIQCDVLNEADVVQKIAPLTDVTHLFWVVWVNRRNEDQNIVDNGKMLQNVLNVLLPNAPKFQHICLQTGGKHYTVPFEYVGNVARPKPPYREEMARLPVKNFYYTLEDIVFETVKKKEGLTWSVHRPAAIFGYSPGSLMNILGSLAVYAAVCKHEGLPFLFPGNKIIWEQFGDFSDAELIAEQEIWASIEAKGKNQAFNSTNGDVFSYKRIWTLLAEKFGLEVPVPACDGQPKSLEEMMKGKEPVWKEIVEKHGLYPTKLAGVGNWWFPDIILNLPFIRVSSMNKSKELGFWGFRDSEASTLYWLDKMRRNKIIP